MKVSAKYPSFDDFLIALLPNIDPSGTGKTYFANLAVGFKK